MSQNVDRDKVFQTTRVRTTLKNDLSWIHKSKENKKETDNARTGQAVETRPVVVRQSSYVLSAAKKFESVDAPLSPPLRNTQFTPSEGDSANMANGAVIPSEKDAQPEGSTVETTDDTKPQAPTEELIQNGEAQPENSVTNTTAENKEDTADNKSNVEHNEGAAAVSADVHTEEHIPNGEAQQQSSTKENPVAVPPLEPSEQPVAYTTAENNADTTVDQSIIEQTEGAAEVSADVHVEEHTPNGETQPESSTNEYPEAVPPVEPAEQPAADTATENKADIAVDQSNVDADVKSPTAETAAGTEESEDTAAEVPGADAVEPQKESSSDTEPATATNLEATGVDSMVQPAEQAADEVFEAVAAVVVESSPDKSDVINATPGEEAALQDSVKSVPDLPAESGTETPAQLAAESATEGSAPEEAAGETVKAVAEVTMESTPETAAVTNAAEEVAPQDSVEPVPDLVPDTVPESSAHLAAETAVTSEECKVESAASAEPVLQTRAEEVVESEAVAEQSVEPTPDPVVELSIEDALEPVTASDDKVADRPIELTDALDLEPPAAEVVTESQKDPEQSHTEETTLNHQLDHTNNSEISQKPVEEQQSTQSLYETRDGKSVCAFCDKTIDGKVRIIFSEPLEVYHPDCLQCGVCAMALGDLMTPMFLYNQVIQCDGCFAKALKT